MKKISRRRPAPILSTAALEDARQELNHRLHVPPPGMDAADKQALENISLMCSLQPLRDGGVRQLEECLAQARKGGRPFKLLVIDAYFAVPSNRKRRDWVADDYRGMAVLRQRCSRYNCAVILVHHLHKATSKYAADLVFGTTGLTAAVDAWWIMTCDPVNSAYRLMEVRGRSIPEVTRRIGFDANSTNPGIHTEPKMLN